MPAAERTADLEFPDAGLNVLTELQGQPPGTTAGCQNVRAVNPDSLRQRGGSRAGLVKYIPDPLITGGSVIQHLAVIVDPQADRLRTAFVPPGDDWVEDPLFPGTFVPPGGWGNQPNPEATQPSSGSSSITFAQCNRDRIADLDAERFYDFDTWFDLEVVISHTIVVAVMTQENAPGTATGTTITLTNDGGATYTRLNQAAGNGGYERITNDDGNEMTLSFWKKRVSATADKAFRINASQPGCFCEWIMVEYDNVALTTPTGFDFKGVTTPTTALASDQFSSGTDQAVLAIFATDRESSSGAVNLTNAAGFTQRKELTNAVQLHFADDVDHGSDINMTVTATTDQNVRYIALGVALFAQT